MNETMWNTFHLPSFHKKNKPYKFSRRFSLDMEKGMSPSRLLEDKSLDQKDTRYFYSSKQYGELKLKPTYSVLSDEQSPISSGICPESSFDFKSLHITEQTGRTS